MKEPTPLERERARVMKLESEIARLTKELDRWVAAFTKGGGRKKSSKTRSATG